MPRQIVAVDPTFGQRLKELRERRGLSLRRLGQRVHCSHGYLWDLEAGGKRPSLSVVTLLDAALDAGGQLSALVRTVSADSGGQLAPPAEPVGVPGAGLEFASDWRHGVVVATKLWRDDMQRRDLLVDTGFSAALFLTPALRWLTTRLAEQPARDARS